MPKSVANLDSPSESPPVTRLPATTVVVVRLTPATGTGVDDLVAIAENARGKFVGIPGLQCKYFAYAPDRGEVVNVYVWNDSHQAAQMRKPEFLARIRAAYGSEPDVTVAAVLSVAASE